MRTILILITTMAFSLSSFAADRALQKQFDSMKNEKRVALVIGNSNYKSNPLKNPVNDARLMSSTLKSLGFETLLYTDASQKQMKMAIDQFGQKIKNNQGVGLFYYAGHGMQVNGRNYLIPVGADITDENEVEYEAIDSGRVLAKMENANNRLNLVFLDACRNNPYARSFRSVTNGLASVNAPSGTFIAYATAPGSVAADGRGSNGIFTENLVKHMNTEGLTIERLFKYVRMDVEDNTGGKQTPWTSSSLKGDFYFKLPAQYADTEYAFVEKPAKPATYTPPPAVIPTPPPAAVVPSPAARPVGYKLTVNTVPANATIKILSHNMPFSNGMTLRPGGYFLQVSAAGYESVQKLAVVRSDTVLDISLKKEASFEELSPELFVGSDELLGGWKWGTDVAYFMNNGRGIYYRDGQVCFHFDYDTDNNVIHEKADGPHRCGGLENRYNYTISGAKMTKKHIGSGYETKWVKQ